MIVAYFDCSPANLILQNDEISREINGRGELLDNGHYELLVEPL
jgi:hypothetical protein